MYLSRRYRHGLQNRRGFTLIEILVAVSLSFIVILSLYYIFQTSSTSFRIQEQVTSAMSIARFAADQVSRDISSAGFLATPNSSSDANVCPKPTNALMGISLTRQTEDTENDNIVPVSIALLGSWWSTTQYLSQSVIGNLVTLQGSATGAPYPTSQIDFDLIFAPGRLLRIVNAEQFEFYIPIQSADYTNGTITLTQSVPVTSPPDFCGVQGLGVGLEVNVVGYIRYRLAVDPNPPNDAVHKIDLIRDELDPSDPTLNTVVENSMIRVAEYVVDLQFYDFVVDTDRSSNAPTMTIIPYVAGVLDSGSQKLDFSSSARPQDLRALTMKITARTADEDPSWTNVLRPSLTAPIVSYEVDKTLEGSARTVSLATRINIGSFTVRNVK